MERTRVAFCPRLSHNAATLPKDAEHWPRPRRTSALRIYRTRGNPVDLGGQCRKINVRINLGERVSQRVYLLAVMFVGKQVGLDGVTQFHRNGLELDSERRNFTKWAGFFGALLLIPDPDLALRYEHDG